MQHPHLEVLVAGVRIDVAAGMVSVVMMLIGMGIWAGALAGGIVDARRRLLKILGERGIDLTEPKFTQPIYRGST